MAGLVAVLAAIVAARVIALTLGPPPADLAMLVYSVVAPGAYLVPGLVLLLRRRWHVIGWLLCLVAVGMSFSFSSDWGAIRFGGPWIAWTLGLFEGSLFWLPFVALLVAFPDGLAERTGRQRALARAVIVVAVCAVLPEALATHGRSATAS